MRTKAGNHEQDPLATQQVRAAAVELVDVTRRYGRGNNSVVALDGVSAAFAPGSFSAVMGLSGSGKSTLLQLAAGLDRPSSGIVRLGGSELGGLSRRKLAILRRRRVGFVFQDLNLVPSLSVAQNIALPLHLDHKLAGKKRIIELAELVGITDQLHRLPHTLSGGQQQRVAIARALVADPDVVFADEPTAALDPYTSEAITELLRRAVDELRQTVVVVTHEPAVAASADRVLVLDHGLAPRRGDQPDSRGTRRGPAPTRGGRAMRALYATLRHRPAPLAGIFVALTMTAMFLTWAITLGGAASATIVPAQRLASAAIVVQGNPTVQEISGSGPSASVDSKPLTSYREVPASLITRLAALPGVRAAVADQSVPVALQLPGHRIVTGTSAGSLVGYGWQSAILTPFRLVAGHAPEGPDQVVLAAGVASAAGLSVGDQVYSPDKPGRRSPWPASRPRPPASGRRLAVFFSSQQAAVLSGHPGQADLIGIVAQPGAAAAGLAARVRAIVAGRQLSVLTGNSRGTAKELGATDELSRLSDIADTNGGINVYVSLFVAASVVALSVAERSRIWALLLAVGATPGQVRRAVMSELAVLGALAAPRYLPGVWLASFTVRGLAAHQLVPAATRISPHPVVILAASGVAIGIAEIAGLLAAFRASRTRPTVALGEAAVELRTIGPLRRVLGAVALAASRACHPCPDAVQRLAAHSAGGDGDPPFIAAIAFAGPFLVSRAERLLSRPLRMLGGIAGGLAGAELRVRPRRVSAAAAAIAMSVAYLGAISVINATSAHAEAVQAAAAAASAVVSGYRAWRAPRSCPRSGASRVPVTRSGSRGHHRLPARRPVGREHACRGRHPRAPSGLLRLGVTSGSLQGFGPGDIALSRIAAGRAPHRLARPDHHRLPGRLRTRTGEGNRDLLPVSLLGRLT